jgi:hypothetical protein
LYLGHFLAYFATLSPLKDIRKIPRDGGDKTNVGKMLGKIEKMIDDIV